MNKIAGLLLGLFLASSAHALTEPSFSAACSQQGGAFNVTLNWNAVAGATNYPVRLEGSSAASNAGGTIGQPPSVVSVNGNGSDASFGAAPSGTSFIYTGLTAGAYAYWGHAWSASGWSNHTKRTVNCGLVLTENSGAAPVPQAFAGIQDKRIFQRGANNKAVFTLTRTAQEPAAAYRRLKIINEVGATVKTYAHESAPFGSTVSIDDATGMEYHRVVASYFNTSGMEIYRFTSAQYAVGEVFIAAGQSNSATHGETPKASAVLKNRMVNPVTGEWLALQDPMPMASDYSLEFFKRPADPNGFTGGSIWPRFADILSNALGVPVAVASVGWGGSSVKDWQKGQCFYRYADTHFTSTDPLIASRNDPSCNPNTDLFPKLISAANAMNGCSFRAVLWHLGETDAWGRNFYYNHPNPSNEGVTSRDDYRNRMLSLVNTFKSDTGCQNKWVMAQAAWLPLPMIPAHKQADIAAIRAAQNDLLSFSSFAAGPDLDQYTQYPSQRYDGIHFSDAGLTMAAQLWVRKVGEAFNLPNTQVAVTIPSQPAEVPVEPAFTAICLKLNTTWSIDVSWFNSPGAINYPIRIQGLSTAANAGVVITSAADPVSAWGLGAVGDAAPTGILAENYSRHFVGENFALPGTYTVWMHAWNAAGWSAYTKKTVVCPA